MKIATWNINSIRLREPIVLRFLREYAPDILCLQETKCPDDQFRHEVYDGLGYRHRAVRGEKGYNGVAILSRLPFEASGHCNFVGKQDCRHISARIGGVTVHNFYVPAGGDVPDPDANEKFAHKLDFVDEMTAWLGEGGAAPDGPSVLVGDLNIAPLEHDVWSHKQLLKVVSHTPVEVERLAQTQASRGWIDIARRFVPETEKLYSWWSYRARDWEASDRGRRLDHIWVTPDLGDRLGSFEIVRSARGWDKPSDHAPIIAEVG